MSTNPTYTVDRHDFVDALQRASLVANGKSAQDVDRLIVIAADTTTQTLTIRAFRNGVYGIAITIPATVTESHTCGVLYTDVASRVGFLPAERLELFALRSELGVRADAIRTAIPCVTAIAIPYDVVQDFHTVCTLQSDALLRALTMAVITADPSSNVVTHCVHVVIADDMLTVVGASPNLGVTHTRATIAPIDTAIDILLPRGIAQLLGGVLDGTTFTLLQDDKQNQVAFRCGNTTFHTVLGGGTYPDAIEGIVATRPTTTCMASIKGLESILGLIRQSKTERDTTTRAVLVLSPTVLHVKAPGRGYAGKSEARFPIELVGKPVTIECNADEMLDVLRAIRGTTIDLGITDRGFIRVTSPDDLGMVHVASPIRVEWEKTEE